MLLSSRSAPPFRRRITLRYPTNSLLFNDSAVFTPRFFQASHPAKKGKYNQVRPCLNGKGLTGKLDYRYERFFGGQSPQVILPLATEVTGALIDCSTDNTLKRFPECPVTTRASFFLFFVGKILGFSLAQPPVGLGDLHKFF